MAWHSLYPLFLKFKQHKDNPSQIPIGTPIALVLIAGGVLFLPSLLGAFGATMFGHAPKPLAPKALFLGFENTAHKPLQESIHKKKENGFMGYNPQRTTTYKAQYERAIGK